MNSNRLNLSKITQTLVQSGNDFPALTQAVTDMERLFFSLTGVQPEKPEFADAIFLPNGKAISPFWAGFCVRDLLRTKNFIRGLYLAIREAQRKFPSQTINVLYAGTGPFATLAMPLTTMFDASEVNFILLEVNPHSISCLRKVVKGLKAEAYVREIVQADAAFYQKEKHLPLHIVLTETMQHALKKEPQVAITLNLARQLEEGGILVPENVRVEAGLLNSGENQRRMFGEQGEGEECYLILKEILQVNLTTIKNLRFEVDKKTGRQVLPPEWIELPSPFPGSFRKVCLFTSIQVFGPCELAYWQSGLTLPLLLTEFDPAEIPSGKICFQYELSDSPGFRFTVLNRPALSV